jgi:glycosyltransferase involved in cell wall biosynthesis
MATYFEDTYALPRSYEGWPDKLSFEASWVAETILRQQSQNPEQSLRLCTERPEIFAALAKLEALCGQSLFKRHFESLSPSLIESAFPQARRAMSPFYPLSRKEFSAFFENKARDAADDFVQKVYPLSLIVPCYRPRRFLESFASQVPGLLAFVQEILVVDDASPEDEYEALVQALSPLGDRVRLLRHPRNQGPGAARNYGLREARGEWVSFLDFDDRLDLELLPFALKALEQDKLSQIFTTHLLKKPLNLHYVARTPSFPDLAFENTVAVNIFARKDFLLGLPFPLYNEELSGHFEDWEANLALRLWGYKIRILPLATYQYHVHEGGRQLSSLDSQWESRKLVAQVYERLPKFKREKMALKWAQLLALKVQALAQREHEKLHAKNFSALLSRIGRKLDSVLTRE